MRVLVLENEGFAAEPVVKELQDAGIDVARCNDPDGPAFPCNGLIDGHGCPLDGETISVAVLTGHSAPSDRDLAPREQGARCALRQHIPLVVVGTRPTSPVLPYATGFAEDADAVVEAVRTAAEARLPDHERAARTAFREVLDKHDLPDVEADVRARRHEGGVRIELCPSIAIPMKVSEVAGVRVVAAVRALDPYAGYLSVTIDDDAAA